MTTQADDIKKEIHKLEMMLTHATMMGDTKHQKQFENKIMDLRSTLYNIQ